MVSTLSAVVQSRDANYLVDSPPLDIDCSNGEASGLVWRMGFLKAFVKNFV